MSTIAEEAPVVVWMTDPRGACVYLNKRWFDTTGQAPDEALGFGWLDATHPDDQPRTAECFRSANEARLPFRLEYRLRQRDGSYRWAVDVGTPRFDEAGSFLGFVGSVVDIDDNKQVQEQLAYRENQLRLATEAAEIGLWDVDLVNDTLFWPPEVKRLFGISPDVPVSMDDFYAGLHPDDLDRVSKAFAAAADPDQRATYDVEYRTVGKEDGVHRWVAAKGRGIFDEQGRCIRVIGTALDITARRSSEELRHATSEALRTSEERLRLAARAARIGTWDLDLRSGSGEWDDMALAIGGIPPSAGRRYTAESWTSLVHPEDRERVHTAFTASLQENGPPYDVEFRSSWPMEDGGDRWLASHGAILRDESGSPVRAVGILRDTTTAKRAQVAVEESNARFQALVATIPSIVWFAAPTGEVEYFNHRWFEYTGQTPEEALPDGWLNTLHPDDQQVTMTTWSRALEAGTPYEVECRYRRGNGTYRWHVVRAEPLFDLGTSSITGWFGTSTDIHDQKMAAERLDLALNAGAIQGTWVWDVRRDLVTADERFARTFGLSAEDCRVGVPIASAVASIHPDDRDRVSAAISDVLETGGSYRIEYRVRNSDGVYRWVEASGQVEMDAGGQPVRFPGVAVDVEERRAAEERERLLAREVDHRAKNLLGVIQSVVQLTRADDVAELKKAINGRVQALARAHSLLAASRWEGIQLRGLVEEELAPFSKDSPDRIGVAGPVIELRPSSSQALALAIHELATNAVKYGALSVSDGRIAVSWWLDDSDSLCFRWVESGVPNVARPTSKGFGSVVIQSSIERQLAGTMSLDWHLDGLECVICIPSKHLATRIANRSLNKPEALQEYHGASLNGREVLIVEDETLLALQLERIIVDAGGQVRGPAASIEAALGLLKSGTPDLAIIDVNLDGEQSSSVADALVAAKIPFAYCTGYADTTGRPDLRYGVPRLKKPIDEAAVRQVLQTLASHSSDRSDPASGTELGAEVAN